MFTVLYVMHRGNIYVYVFKFIYNVYACNLYIVFTGLYVMERCNIYLLFTGLYIMFMLLIYI